MSCWESFPTLKGQHRFPVSSPGIFVLSHSAFHGLHRDGGEWLGVSVGRRMGQATGPCLNPSWVFLPSQAHRKN